MSVFKSAAKKDKNDNKENNKKRAAKTGEGKEGESTNGSNDANKDGNSKKGPETKKPTSGRKKKEGECDDAFTSEIMKCFVASNAKKHEVELAHTSKLKRHNEVIEVIALKEQALKERQSNFDFNVKQLKQFA